MTRPPLRSWILLTLLALPVAFGVSEAKQQRDATASGKSFAQRQAPEAGIPRFAEIRPGLSRGGEPDEAALKYLHDRGYKTILSFLTDPSESAFVVESGMKYIHIPMRSGPFSCQPPTDDQVRRFLAATTDTTLYPMFIHCHAGKDRTGAMTAIYRMETCGWTTNEAVEEMKAFGFAGRYKRLFNYVQSYSPHPALSDVNVADTKEP
jgi:protein tyrosine/serine phosphatase